MAGWIKIYRRLDRHWVWENESYLKAWLTILLRVSFEDKKVLVKGELIDCKRGQSVCSLQTWANEFGSGWTIQKVRTFFDLLKKEQMINTEGLPKTTRLTVLNYDSYQEQQQTDNRQKPFDPTDKQQTDNRQITTIKEGKEVKNKEYKKLFLSEIKISDVEINPNYLETALAFQKLFKRNLEEAGASVAIIEKAKGTWIDDIRLMIEKDGYTLEDLRDVYVFLQKDSFWKQNILSTSKLREQIGKVKLKMHNGKSRGNNKEATSWDELAEIVKHSFEGS